jgi:hypothetical protein
VYDADEYARRSRRDLIGHNVVALQGKTPELAAPRPGEPAQLRKVGRSSVDVVIGIGSTALLTLLLGLPAGTENTADGNPDSE